jgi:hypothetical protein
VKNKETADDYGRSPTGHNNVHIQFGGFGVLIKFQFHYLHLSRGTYFNLVGLGIPLRFIAKPS